MSSTARVNSYVPKIVTPGPDMYFRKDVIQDFKKKVLKKNVIGVPFGSQEQRQWNKSEKNINSVPGPGSYIDPAKSTFTIV